MSTNGTANDTIDSVGMIEEETTTTEEQTTTTTATTIATTVATTTTQPPTTPPPTTIPQPEGTVPANAEQFTSEDGKLHIAYSPDWEPAPRAAYKIGAEAAGVDEEDVRAVWYVGDYVDDFRPNVSILTHRVPGLSLRGALNELISGYERGDGELIDSGITIGTDGNELAFVHFSGEVQENPELDYLTFVSLADGEAAVATFTASPNAYKDSGEQVRSYMLTLRLGPS